MWNTANIFVLYFLFFFNDFNGYFSSIVEELVTKIIKQDNNDLSKHSYKQYLVNAFRQPFAPIKLKSVTESEIYEINKSLKWKTSYGYDEVPLWIVKLSMPFISSPLIYICNKMLSTGTFCYSAKIFSSFSVV